MNASPTYTTAEQAAADATRLGPPHPYWDEVHTDLVRLVSDPASNSDALLILADGCRRYGSDPVFHAAKPEAAAKLIEWANTLADIAPTRANPIEDR